MITAFFKEEFFNQNLSLFALTDPETALHLELLLDNFELEPCLTEKQEANLKRSRFGLADYYHDPSGALEEMERSLPKSLFVHADVIYFYGIGLGYGYEALKNWLKIKPTHHVVFLEDQLEVLYYFFHTELATQLLKDGQVTLFYFKSYENDVHRFSQLHSLFLRRHLDFFVLPYYSLRREQESFNLCYLILHNFSLTNEIHTEYQTGQFGFLKNFYPNLLKLSDSYLGNYLFKEFKNIPAIICGAGPSLKKNIQLLKSLSSHALIFAGGSALNVLNEENVMPHFGLGIDPNSEQTHRLLTNHTFHLPYFYRQRVNHAAIDLIPGPKIYISGSHNKLANWFEKELNISISSIDEGHNVVNFCTEIASLLGCNPIIFVGLDLAYLPKEAAGEEIETYAKGIQTHPLWIEKSKPYQVNSQERLVNRFDIHNQLVQTRWDWISEAVWISHFAKTHPTIEFINATEGGIGFTNIANLSLQKVKKSYLLKEYDLTSWIHTAIQNAPKATTKYQVIAVMQAMQASLQDSLLVCQNLLKEKNEQLQSTSEMSPVFYTYQTILAEDHLEKELAYQHFLKTFDQHFNYLNEAKNLLSPPSSSFFLNQFERIKFLYKTLYQHLQLLVYAVQQSISQNTFEKNPLKKEDFFSESFICPVYLFENNLKDFSLQESLKNYYADGKIKQQSFYLEGHLHGPSCFYSPQGILLAASYFHYGIKQNFCYHYYESGSPSSIEYYQSGLLEGKQSYFYENGALYVVMHYKNGILNGLVSLYFPDGQLKRQLDYKEGKRDKKERLWNSQGKLVMECEYELGHPVRIAREWNNEGQLIREIEFHGSCQDFDLSLWNREGEKIKCYKHGIEDFTFVYQKTQEQVAVIEKGLQNLVQKMDNLIKERTDELKESYPKLEEELLQLHQAFKEMDNLKKQMIEQMNNHIQINEERRKEHLKNLKKEKSDFL